MRFPKRDGAGRRVLNVLRPCAGSHVYVTWRGRPVRGCDFCSDCETARGGQWENQLSAADVGDFAISMQVRSGKGPRVEGLASDF